MTTDIPRKVEEELKAFLRDQSEKGPVLIVGSDYKPLLHEPAFSGIDNYIVAMNAHIVRGLGIPKGMLTGSIVFSGPLWQDILHRCPHKSKKKRIRKKWAKKYLGL